MSVEGQRTDAPALALLAAGHMYVDLTQGAVPAMLPFLVQSRHLSYAAAAGLVFAQTFSSSIVQPVFGRLSDRWPTPWMLPIGVTVAGLGLAAAGVLLTYPTIWLAIAAGGLGIAAYHPDGARYANHASGDRRGAGMSYFSVGGSVGFAAGPLLAAPVLSLLGLGGVWLLAVPGLAVGLALAAQRRRIGSLRAVREATLRRPGSTPAGRDRWAAFLPLTAAVLVRSAAFYGLTTFIPLYWIATFGQSKGGAGVALSIVLVSGIAGTLLGGRLGDRFPRRSVIAWGMAATALLAFALWRSTDVVVATALLVPLGIALHVPSGLVVLLGQEYLPNRMGTASGVTLGLAVSMGGVAAPALGAVGDHFGLQSVLLQVAALSVVVAAITTALPSSKPSTEG